MKSEDVPAIVEIHQASWSPSEISVKLGPKFLNLFYSAILQAPDAFTYLFEDNGKIVAYSSGFYKYRNFNRRLIKSNWVLFAWIVLSRFISGKLAVADIFNIFHDSNSSVIEARSMRHVA